AVGDPRNEVCELRLRRYELCWDLDESNLRNWCAQESANGADDALRDHHAGDFRPAVVSGLDDINLTAVAQERDGVGRAPPLPYEGVSAEGRWCGRRRCRLGTASRSRLLRLGFFFVAVRRHR